MSGYSKDRSNRFTGYNSGVDGPEPMDVEENRDAGGSKRLSEPFILQKILLEKSGDTSGITTLALSVHAIMLESGFVLLDSCSNEFDFSKELPSVSLKYTLPDLIKNSLKEAKIEYVTVTFRNLAGLVVVNGNGYSGRVHMTYLDKRKFLSLMDLVMDTLKFEKQVSFNSYCDVFVLWRKVKDDVVFPLLIDLCDKAGLESPPCLMRLPTEIKQKILESLPGVSIGNMACVCKEMRNLTSNNDLWKQKYVEEGYKTLIGDVNWKNAYAEFWRDKRRPLHLERRDFLSGNTQFSRIRNPQGRFPWFGGDRFSGSIGIHPGQPSGAWEQRFGGRCNLGGRYWQA